MLYYIIPASLLGYLAYKVYSGTQPPKGWENIPTIPLLKSIWSALTNPLPIDQSYEMHTKQNMEKMGMMKFMAMTEGWYLFVSDPNCLREIMKNTDTFAKLSFAPDNQPLFKSFLGANHVVSTNGEDWKRMRKIINPVFNRSWDPEIFGNCFLQVINEWEKHGNKHILIHDQIQRMTLEVLGKFIFDIDFNAVTDENSKIYKLYHELITDIYKDILYLLFPFLDKIPFLKRMKIYAKADEYNQLVDSIIEDRKIEIANGEANETNLLTQLIKSNSYEQDSESKLSDIELRDNLKVFILAGHDTTANTLSTTIYYLSKYPDVQIKLRDEVLGVLGNSSSVQIPTVDQLKEMPYLNMVIKESMRIMATAGVLQRKVEKDFTFSNGVHCPAGTGISLHLWGMFHNERYFPNHSEFIPERFEDPNSEANKLWMPFLIGARTCIGATFSLMEQRVVLAMILQKYTLGIREENPDFERLRLTLYGLPRPLDLKIDLTPRI